MSKTFGELLGAEILERREAAGMTQRELAEESFDDPDKTDTIIRRIRELESATPPANPRPKIYQPLCDMLTITREEIRAMKVRAANRREQADTEREELREDIGPLPDALADPSGLSRNQLIALAELFGADGPEAQTDATLREYLATKGNDYRRLQAENDDLRGLSNWFDNMRASVKAALEELDFDKAEKRIEDAREIIRDQLREPLELNAKLSERQAEIALLRNDPDHAYRLLSAAADSFASIDPQEPVKRSYGHIDRLYQHGLKYSGPALALARDMAAQRLASVTAEDHPKQWADMQIFLGNALANLGKRTGDPDTLRRAIKAFEAALEVYTREASEMDWAGIQNNLGNALGDLGTQAGGPDTLRRAIKAYEAALEVYTREASEMDWAMTQHNLSIAKDDLTALLPEADRPALLAEALAHADAALEVWTPEAAAGYHQIATNARNKILAAQSGD